MTLFRIARRALRVINHQGYVLVWANLFWIALTALIVTAPAAWAGMARLCHRSQTESQVTLEAFWSGFREHFWRGLALGMLTLVIVVVNITNLAAYPSDGSVGVLLLRVAWTVALLLWLSIFLYFWVIIEEMEQPTLLAGLRNAALMALRHPFVTLQLWILLLLVVALSSILVPMWFLLTAAIINTLVTTTVLVILEQDGYKIPRQVP